MMSCLLLRFGVASVLLCVRSHLQLYFGFLANMMALEAGEANNATASYLLIIHSSKLLRRLPERWMLYQISFVEPAEVSFLRRLAIVLRHVYFTFGLSVPLYSFARRATHVFD